MSSVWAGIDSSIVDPQLLTLSLYGDGGTLGPDPDPPKMRHLWLRNRDVPMSGDFRRQEVLCGRLGDNPVDWWVCLELDPPVPVALTTDRDEVTCLDCLGWLHA